MSIDPVREAIDPMLNHWRDKYGIAVMQEGLPKGKDLGGGMLNINRALRTLAPELPNKPALSTYGLYFNDSAKKPFRADDGYGGKTALHIHPDATHDDLVPFFRDVFKDKNGPWIGWR